MSEDTLVEKAQIAKQAGAQVEIVGAWVWAEFPRRPSLAVRQALKDAGYHWNHKREVWQWAGRPCRHSPAMSFQIKLKYGSQEVEALA